MANSVPAGQSIAVIPVLYEGHWNELQRQSPILKKHDLRLVPFDATNAAEARYVLMFMRFESLPDEFRKPLDDRRVVISNRRQGVPLALLFDRQ